MRQTLKSTEGWTRSLSHPQYPDDDVCDKMLPHDTNPVEKTDVNSFEGEINGQSEGSSAPLTKKPA